MVSRQNENGQRRWVCFWNLDGCLLDPEAVTGFRSGRPASMCQSLSSESHVRRWWAAAACIMRYPLALSARSGHKSELLSSTK